MKIDPNAPAFPAALSMNQHQRYSFLGSVGIPDSSGDYVTFDSLCRMKAAAEEIIAQHATLRASVAELESERETLARSLSAAKQVIASKEQAAALYDKQLAGLREARETLDSERSANAALTDENARLWAWHDAVMAQAHCDGLTIRPQPLTKGK